MTYDETKMLLDEIKHKKTLLRTVKRQIEEARSQIDCLRAQDYGGIAVQGGRKEAVAERFVEHMERLEKRYESLMNEAFRCEDMLSDALPKLTDIEQAIIIERYIHGKSWRKIQQEFNYAERQPYRIADSAIKKISKNLKDGSK